MAGLAAGLCAAPAGVPSPDRRVLRGKGGVNLLAPSAWRDYGEGFVRKDGVFLCDNGKDGKAERGAAQTVVLDQEEPRPIVAKAWSKAEAVGPGARGDYALYLDLLYRDGTPLWGQIASFSAGTHDWEERRVVVMPEKPVKRVSFYLLLRGRTGRAWFRDPVLCTPVPPGGACLFDGLPVKVEAPPREGFLVRDAAADSDFLRLRPGKKVLGLRLEAKETRRGGATLVEAELFDLKGSDRAVTLVYTFPLGKGAWQWLAGPGAGTPALPPREYTFTSRHERAGTTRLSRLPFAAVRAGKRGKALGIDAAAPAFFRAFYAAGTGELAVAFDLGLAPEKRSARVRVVRFSFDATWGFRSALQAYYDLFPESFRCRTPEQGLWMPFAPVSKVKGWEDFGFKFKEGTNETAWDDAHGLLTFRYTEPQTWWMPLPKGSPRTLESALSIARKRADKGDRRARAFFTSAYHDEHGRPCVRFRDTPWCNGAVWSLSGLPGLRGEWTDFKLAWNPEYVETHYGKARDADLDGEYVDSSEGYVTAELDFRRDHFAAAETPLTFDCYTRRPAVFRGLAVFEYVRALAREVHRRGKLMMANGTPNRLCWLAPFLDVMGTETDWNPGGRWRPMAHGELFYRRALCGPKPFCFLMNTRFERFPPERVEAYMKRCLAYGMFPGFFSHNASEAAYFTRPELYDRDRPLFKKYVPLCKRVAEAGWRPVTLARAGDPALLLERFGKRYLTAFNASDAPLETTITLEAGLRARSARDLVSGRAIPLSGRTLRLQLAAGDVAVLELGR